MEPLRAEHPQAQLSVFSRCLRCGYIIKGMTVVPASEAGQAHVGVRCEECGWRDDAAMSQEEVEQAAMSVGDLAAPPAELTMLFEPANRGAAPSPASSEADEGAVLARAAVPFLRTPNAPALPLLCAAPRRRTTSSMLTPKTPPRARSRWEALVLTCCALAALLAGVFELTFLREHLSTRAFIAVAVVLLPVAGALFVHGSVEVWRSVRR